MSGGKKHRLPEAESIYLAHYKDFPHSPGIYKFYDREKDLLYIGKAKDLKKRVHSYFQRSASHNYKTKKMVIETAFFGFFCVASEQDALFLEKNLIQKHQPKYNIMLRDDKSYPYLCVTRERFPRVFITRRLREGARYYGPHANVHWLHQLLRDLRKSYKIRTCKLLLSEQAVAKGQYKVCLEYHLGNCLGPCEALQKEEDYQQNIREVESIIKGELSSVRKDYEHKIAHYASALCYERAREYREKLDGLDKFCTNSLVSNPKWGSLDCFAWTEDEDKVLYVHHLRVEDGTLVLGESMKVKNTLKERKEDIIPIIMVHLLDKHEIAARAILSNVAVPSWSSRVRIKVPVRGDKKKILALAMQNALLLRARCQTTKKHDTLILQEALSLRENPRHIECFDISNDGSTMVASVVCFVDGAPAKRDHRRMQIRTVDHQDDCACMREAVYRRYHRALQEKRRLPSLVVIDGGKGQLNAAVSSLDGLGLSAKISVISLAKRLEEIHMPGRKNPIRLTKEHPALHLVQSVRDEAHAFAVRYLRQKKTDKDLRSALTQVQGIGRESARKLLRAFPSHKTMREADINRLAKIVGAKRATLVKKALTKEINTPKVPSQSPPAGAPTS